MNKKALDEKYSYQIEEHNVVHLFRGEDDCQQYLTNPLLSAIFKIETLEKENAELKEDNSEWEKASDKWKSLYESTNNQFTKAKEIIRKLIDDYIKIGSAWVDVSLVKKAEGLLKGTEE